MMATLGKHVFGRVFGALAVASALVAPVSAALAREGADLESAFDRTFTARPATAPLPLSPAPATAAYSFRSYGSSLEQQVAALASPEQGRIGVAAVDLTSGRSVDVLGSQPFPMASTSKIAVVATFLEGVDQGRWRLSDMYPLMVPVRSARGSDSPVAPVQPGEMMSAASLIELALTRSSNPATDALLAAVGGPQSVNGWIRRAGISGMRMDRDIATLVRDDGALDPARTIDLRDSATPRAMVTLLSGLYQGQWLSPQSRDFLIQTMERCVTGRHRIVSQLPEGTRVAHKTGTLSNTASDVGIIHTPDGRAIAVAIYVTGQGGKPNRDARIATIARAIYDGYLTESSGVRRTASR